MRNLKRFSSLLFTSAMMLGSILPTASIPVLANEDVPPVVKVNVVGEGNVLVTDVDAGKSQFALESSPLEDSFKEGTKLELKCDGQKQIVSDVSIDGVTQDYEYGNQKLELDYTTPSESSEIIVTFSDKQAEAKEAELPVADKKNEETEKLTIIETENHPEKEADEKANNGFLPYTSIRIPCKSDISSASILKSSALNMLQSSLIFSIRSDGMLLNSIVSIHQ